MAVDPGGPADQGFAMSGAALPFTLTDEHPPQLGLVVLQADETIEMEFRRLLPQEAELLVTRIPSGDEVTPDSLGAMKAHLADAARLLPRAARLSVLGYGCTSGAAEIGPTEVARQLHSVTGAAAITDPLTALIAACRTLGVTRLGLLSPYIAEVSQRLRDRLDAEGIATPVFGSFETADEARVVRISEASIAEAALALAERGGIDALFLSCTNLRTLNLIGGLEATLGLPVLASNPVLAWHMTRLAGLVPPPAAPGQIFRA